MEICFQIAFQVKYVAERSGGSPVLPDRDGGFLPNEAGECDMDDTFKKRTLTVYAGARRSQYCEVSEAIFLTQDFVCETA